MPPPDGTWSVYVLRCADGTLYTGIATDVERRVAEHQGSRKGSRYLRGRGPLTLVFRSEVGSRSIATRAELRFKQLARAAKERLIATPASGDEWLARIGVSRDQER